MAKFIERFEKISCVKRAVYLPNKLHLTIFHKDRCSRKDVQRKVFSEILKSNLDKSVETLSIYGE